MRKDWGSSWREMMTEQHTILPAAKDEFKYQDYIWVDHPLLQYAQQDIYNQVLETRENIRSTATNLPAVIWTLQKYYATRSANPNSFYLLFYDVGALMIKMIKAVLRNVHEKNYPREINDILYEYYDVHQQCGRYQSQFKNKADCRKPDLSGAYDKCMNQIIQGLLLLSYVNNYSHHHTF